MPSQETSDDIVRSETAQLVQEILPVMLRFMADQYDDTSNTIFPVLQTILAGVRQITL